MSWACAVGAGTLHQSQPFRSATHSAGHHTPCSCEQSTSDILGHRLFKFLLNFPGFCGTMGIALFQLEHSLLTRKLTSRDVESIVGPMCRVVAASLQPSRLKDLMDHVQLHCDLQLLPASGCGCSIQLETLSLYFVSLSTYIILAVGVESQVKAYFDL